MLMLYQNDSLQKKVAGKWTEQVCVGTSFYSDLIKCIIGKQNNVLNITDLLARQRKGELKRLNDHLGAYGAIVDCYTVLGDFEQAGKYYDIYISRLETDRL